jgi:uncharacterized protein YcfL
VFICVDGVYFVFVLSFLYFNYFLNSSHKLEIKNLISKETNHINLRFQNIIRSVVMNYYSGISMIVYRSYWYQSRFLWDICEKLQDLGIGFKTKVAKS